MQETTNTNSKPVIYLTPQQAKERFGVKEVYGAIIGKPSITKAQIAEIMHNYRNYIASYNSQVDNNNQKIEEYNVSVFVSVEQLKQHKLHKLDNELLQETYGHLSITEYNDKVELFNAQSPFPVALKKTHKKVKHATQEVFSAIVHKYASDIAKNNQRRELHKLNLQRELEPLSVASTSFCLKDDNGVKRLDYTPRSIKNHIYRLRDAGVLFGYEFHGANRPVEYHINAKILVVFDAKKKETLCTENQLFIISMVKNLPNRRVDTSTNNSKKEIKCDVDNSTPLELGTFLHFFKRNNLLLDHPESNNTQEKTRGRANNPISLQLQQQIEENEVFAENLRLHRYDDYSNAADLLRFTKEAESADCTMLKADFRQLLIQSALKAFAHCWKEKNIWVWPKTIDLFNDEYFKNPNGTIPSKPVLLYMYNNFMLRANWVFKQVKKGWQCQPPSTYFDPTRTTANEAGFGYTLKQLKKLEKEKINSENRKDKRLAAAMQRKKKNTAQQKVINAVKKYKKGLINYNQLINYIVSNETIPNYHLDHLSKYIEIEFKAK